jgi:ABC-2 type transport system ATP-binding protein
VNDPELVILDEPMSGLDPIGRRDVREMILELRDEGRTVLFSSHILSDAELLCSRVGILSRGRLVAAGATGELTAGDSRGWEVVASGVTPALVDRVSVMARKTRRIADDRYSFEMDTNSRPEPLIAVIAAGGAALVSANPVRTTLEDVFLRALAQRPGLGGEPADDPGLAPQ